MTRNNPYGKGETERPLARWTRLRAVGTALVLSLFLGYSACLAADPTPGPTGEGYIFGVVPQFEQRKLHSIWKPITDELQRRTGLKFKLVTTLKIPDFEREFLAAGFDFVYMNPYYMVEASSRGDYLPLVRDQAPLRGILVVPKEGSIKTVADLAGQTVAFPSPNALGASLLMRADLERIHHLTVKPLYVKTHSSVYLHVVKGLAAAGGGVEKSLHQQEQAVQDSLRVIYTTRPLPSHPLAAHSRVPEADREKVRQALLDLDKTPEGRAMLAKIPTSQLQATSLDDYKEMIGWGLEAFWDDKWRED